jgi:hypothetical protein
MNVVAMAAAPAALDETGSSQIGEQLPDLWWHGRATKKFDRPSFTGCASNTSALSLQRIEILTRGTAFRRRKWVTSRFRAAADP